MKTQKGLRELKDLNLLDRFLFAEVIEDREIMELILEIILEKEVKLKQIPQAEREQRGFFLSKQAKLDVLSVSEADELFNTEVQKQKTNNLPKRTRFYHSIITSRLLPAGTVDYNKLNDVYVIMIMPFDLFGEGKYKYCFSMMCKGSPGKELGDGVNTIFLNTRGTDPDGVSDELIALLKYFEHSTKRNAEKHESDRIKRLHKKVESIKSNDEIGVKLMNAWEEKLMFKEEGREEGRKEGESNATLKIARNLKSDGLPVDIIAKNTGLTKEEVEKL